MERLLNAIENANAEELDMILDVVIERKRILYPDWELIYLALPRNDWEKRQRILECALQMERKCKEIGERNGML